MSRPEVPDATKCPPSTYWLTRNRLNGEISIKVDIWLVRPDRLRFKDGDVHWIALSPGDAEASSKAHFGRWTLDRAKHEAGPGTPDTDMECVRVGHDIPVAT